LASLVKPWVTNRESAPRQHKLFLNDQPHCLLSSHHHSHGMTNSWCHLLLSNFFRAEAFFRVPQFTGVIGTARAPPLAFSCSSGFRNACFRSSVFRRYVPPDRLRCFATVRTPHAFRHQNRPASGCDKTTRAFHLMQVCLVYLTDVAS
jgi:hypothetical protein